MEHEAGAAAAMAVTAWFEQLDAAPSWRSSFGRQPFAAPGGASLVTPLLTWEVLHRVLGAPPPIDLMTVRAGELVACAAPRSRHDVRRLFRSGVSFRPNTVAPDVALGDRLDFTAIVRETSPIYTARLVPGDWLHIPSRWWHLVKCVTDSLSISTGVMPVRELARARRVPAGWGARVGLAAASGRW